MLLLSSLHLSSPNNVISCDDVWVNLLPLLQLFDYYESEFSCYETFARKIFVLKYFVGVTPLTLVNACSFARLIFVAAIDYLKDLVAILVQNASCEY